MNPEFEQSLEHQAAAPQSCAGEGPEQERLLEYLDGGLSPLVRRSMTAHIAGCHHCKSLAAQWAELDTELCRDFRGHQLSRHFSSRVWAAVQALPLSGSAGLLSARDQGDAQWSTVWARHRRRFLWMQAPWALDQLGYAFGVVVTLCLLSRLMPKFLSALSGLGQRISADNVIGYAGVASLAVLLVVFACTAKRPFSRFLAEL
jgi:hypothetical protein